MNNDNDYASKFLKENVSTIKDNVYILPCTEILNGNETSSSIKLGNGIVYKDDKIMSVTAGKLVHSSSSSTCSYKINNNKKYYTPRTGDQVIGIIEDKGTDYYKVNIFSGVNSYALLGRLAFEGATKRNKPELKKGDVIYARVLMAHKDLDTELTCLSNTGDYHYYCYYFYFCYNHYHYRIKERMDN